MLNLGSPTELDQLGTGSYTFEAWIKTSYTSRQAIIGNYGSTPAWCFELYSSGQLRMYVKQYRDTIRHLQQMLMMVYGTMLWVLGK